LPRAGEWCISRATRWGEAMLNIPLDFVVAVSPFVAILITWLMSE
jgi:hypothetical protein